MAVSSTLAKETKYWINKDVTVVPNIIDVNRFFHRELSQSKVIQFGFLGGMNTPVKGLDIALKALAKMNHDFIFHIGGTGTLEEHYKKLSNELGVSERCRFYGFVPYNEVPHFMSRLQFFICSSRYETFCVSLIEAIASGRPVISTRCGGPEDFVNGSNGILCDNENPESLQQAIEWMMLNYSSFNPITMRTYIEDNFTAKSFLKTINEVYSTAIARSIN